MPHQITIKPSDHSFAADDGESRQAEHGFATAAATFSSPSGSKSVSVTSPRSSGATPSSAFPVTSVTRSRVSAQ